MKEDHERLYRAIPGEGYCFLCSQRFPTVFDCAVHIEGKHTEIWTQAVALSDRIDRLHAKMAPLEEEAQKIQKEINDAIIEFRRIFEEKYHVSSRN